MIKLKENKNKDRKKYWKILTERNVNKVIRTNNVEKYFYSQLEQLDNTLQKTKDFFRNGNELEDIEELMEKI